MATRTTAAELASLLRPALRSPKRTRGCSTRERRARDAWLTRRLAALTATERDLLRRVVPILDKLAAQ